MYYCLSEIIFLSEIVLPRLRNPAHAGARVRGQRDDGVEAAFYREPFQLLNVEEGRLARDRGAAAAWRHGLYIVLLLQCLLHTGWSPSYESLHTIAKLCGNSSQSGEPVRQARRALLQKGEIPSVSLR